MLMKLRNKLFILVTCILSIPYAQSSVQRTAVLSVSAPENSLIYLNDQLIASTGFDNLALVIGKYTLTAMPTENISWSTRGFEQQFELNPGEHKKIKIRYPHLTTITSDPFGADVFADTQYLGKTPLVISDQVLAENEDVSLKMSGFNEFNLILGNTTIYHAKLSPIAGDINGPVLQTSPERQQNTSLKTSLLVTSFVTSWASFYLKRAADNSYKKYLRTGKPNEMRKYFDQTERYDNWSDVALTVSVASLGTFIYYLLSE